MATVALLFEPQERSLERLDVAGTPVLSRQIEQVRRAGATRIFVLGGRRGFGPDVVNLDTAEMLGARVADGDQVLVLAAGVVADDRIATAVVAAMVAAGAPAVATWPVASRQHGVERLDALTFAAGVAAYPGALVRRVAAGLGDWDLHATLLRTALGDPACARVDLASLPLAASGAQAGGPLTYALVASPADAAAASTAALTDSARARHDAVGRYLCPPIEQWLLRRIAPTPMTPQEVVAIAAATGIAATVAFMAGWPGAALALALLFGPLQDLGPRLARARAIGWRWPHWAALADAVGYSWWLALAGRLAFERGNGGPVAVAALLLLGQLTAVSEAAFFRRFTARALAETDGDAPRWIMFAAGRDSLALLLLPFAIISAWYAGLIALAVYGVISFAALHGRFLRRLGDYGRAAAPVGAADDS